MHLNSELIFKKYASPFFKSGMKVLEIGPYGSPSAYQTIVNNNSIEWHTLNLANSTLDEMGNKDKLTIITNDPYHYPIADNNYDIVLSGNVMEHVQDIMTWFGELKRIIRPGGLIIVVMPLSWPYHEAPVDCWRIYPEGFKSLLASHGLLPEICLFESLEFQVSYPEIKNGSIPLIPGRSIFWDKSKLQVDSQIKWNRLVHNIPFLRRFIIPIEIAYDTITVAVKSLK